MLLLWIILFAAFGGIASAAFAVAFLWVPEERSARILPHCVSFATGALLGAALLALLPEAIEGAGTAGAHDIGLALVLGLGIFFVIEKLVLWWHAHSQDEDSG
ncbi:MAG: ZIP family metal transporter, partial [Gammaproteobacteria bacterium]